MAGSCKPAGFESDDEEDGFLIDFDINKKNSTYSQSDSTQSPNVSFPGGNSRVSFGIPGSPVKDQSHSSRVEDFRVAVTQGNMKAVEETLAKGMDVNTVFSNGWSALMYAGNNAKGEVFQLLLDKGANPNYHKDLYTVLMTTCGCISQEANEVLHCVKLLIQHGADVKAHDRYHMTPLMYAAREGRLDVVDFLLDNGADIDCQDSRGWTALSWATQNSQLGVVKRLLQRGADRNKRHADNLTAIDLARGSEQVVWLFEDKVCNTGEAGAGDASAPDAQSSSAAASGPVPTQKTTSVKYGDLEVFMFGLGLGEFYDLMLTHHVDFPLLLTLDEDDFIKMGITQVGIRKKLIEGVAAVHKRNWESSSLVPIRIKSQVKCADAVAIVANISKHLRYIASSVVYVKDRVNSDPEFLTKSAEGSAPRQLWLHTGDGMKNVAALQLELSHLQAALARKMAGQDFCSPDLITDKTVRRRKLRSRRMAVSLLTVSTLALLVWQRDALVQTGSALLQQLHSRLS